MLQISPKSAKSVPAQGRETVQRFAEQGYQLEPEALEAICRYQGSQEELFRRIIGSIDRSLAVIVGSSRVDLQACKLEYSIVSPK